MNSIRRGWGRERGEREFSSRSRGGENEFASRNHTRRDLHTGLHRADESLNWRDHRSSGPSARQSGGFTPARNIRLDDFSSSASEWMHHNPHEYRGQPFGGPYDCYEQHNGGNNGYIERNEGYGYDEQNSGYANCGPYNNSLNYQQTQEAFAENDPRWSNTCTDAGAYGQFGHSHDFASRPPPV